MMNLCTSIYCKERRTIMINTLSPLETGNVGIAVNKFQAYLNIFQQRGFITTKLVEDGVFGAQTDKAVREYQTYAKLPVTGKIDTQTWNHIVNKLRELGVVTNIPVASKSYYLTQGNQGIDVFKMQEYLNEIAESNPCLRPIPTDANYGRRTVAMVSQFQYLYDLNIDGNIGKATWDAIINERNKL